LETGKESDTNLTLGWLNTEQTKEEVMSMVMLNGHIVTSAIAIAQLKRKE
jgi:hypothetical protein